MTGTSVLLVEGDDDQHVMRHLFDAWQISDIHVLRPGDEPSDRRPGHVKRARDAGEDEDGGGDRKLLDSIPARLETTGLRRMAVVIDADYKEDGKGLRSRWDAICSQLAKEGYNNLPGSPEATGTVLELPAVRGRRPIRFGVWIMPNNRQEGMLEDFLAFLIPQDDKMLPHVDRFLDGIPAGERLFSDIHHPKARIHSYLAVQKEPGKPLGLSITFRYLDAKREVVQPFLDWLTDVLIADGN